MRRAFAVLAAAAAVGLGSAVAFATPYASNVAVSGTNVTFILNEPADQLTYSINGGPDQPLSGATAGTKAFSLGSPTDTFSIKAKRAEYGYTIPTGGSTAPVATGLSQTTNNAFATQISSDSNTFDKYNSPRGVAVSNNPNAPNFGTSYISNSAAGSTGGRALGDGLYAIHADQTDAYGYGDTAQDPGNKFDGLGASANSPFRTTVGPDGNVYTADFSDANGNVWMHNPNLTTPTQLLAAVGGPATPTGQNHGSTTAVAVTGSLGGGNLNIYTLDEDLTTFVSTGAGSTTDKNSLWRYQINGGPTPYAPQPTKINVTNELVPLATSDLTLGADGKWYMMQNRSAGAEAGIVVLDAAGVKLYDSLTDSRTILANPTANDILRNLQGIDVSPDQKFLAALINNSDFVVIPLINGIPDLANRLLVDTGTDVVSGRDIAFDSADNIHYVSSGQALYKVFAPGGMSEYTTSYNGSTYSTGFALAVPEPASVGVLLATAGVAAMARRRRA